MENKRTCNVSKVKFNFRINSTSIALSAPDVTLCSPRKKARRRSTEC